MNLGLRLIAKALMLITAFAALGALQEHRWMLGWVAAAAIASTLTFVAILFHELAHAGVVLWFGGSVSQIVALPFETRLSPFRIRFVGRAGRGDLGGYVSYRLDRVAARRKHAVVAVAGPITNIATGIAAGMVAPMFDTARNGAQFAGAPVGSVIAAAFMLISVGLGLANLIPFDGSDGMRLWRYFRRLDDRI